MLTVGIKDKKKTVFKKWLDVCYFFFPILEMVYPKYKLESGRIYFLVFLHEY